jgi:hypothetical protein
LTPIKVLKSPKNKMTIHSTLYGKEFDGNSILCEISKLEYVYLGDIIMSFTSISPIVKYISPIGNSDVPYPFAIDSNKNYYLMIENVIIKSNNNNKYVFDKSDEPYSVYYKIMNISEPVLNISKDQFELKAELKSEIKEIGMS